MAARPLATVTVDQVERKLNILWGEGEASSFHFVWLRHSGRCSQGMPNDTSVKIDLLPDDPQTLAIKDWSIESENLLIRWQDDGLETSHDLDTLRRSAYDPQARQRRKHRPSLWDEKTATQIPRFEYPDLQTDECRLALMLAVRDFGIAKIVKVPTEPGSIRKVADYLGPIHNNNYGQVFDVKSDANLGLGSNTGVYLPPHTDESYRHDAPGISFFHCLENVESGGESILVDGFNAAQQLKTTDPESFEVLASIPVFFQRYALPTEDMRSHNRILVRDIDGDIVGIRWTDRTLPPQDLPDEYVEPVYKAIRALWKIINSQVTRHQYRMTPGDLHVFDNHRVLHGRSAFNTQTGSRHLQQCSVNRDEFHNSLRTLAAKLKHPASDLVMAGGAVG